MIFLAAVPIVLRLALLPRFPIPTPRVADDFSYLLLGDTLAHFRLANPPHPMHRFFEGVFVLQDPSWSSIFPLGQGLALAFGELVFRLPWAGVVLSVGLLCALTYWMLRAWVNPVWALCGGLLAALEFGPLSSWMNTYWGGAVSAIAGCLVFGALPRRRTRDAVILGIGLSLQLLTRPFEFVLLVAVVLLFAIPRRTLAIAALVLVPAFGLTLLQNKQVTGHWTTLPYQLSRYQYGVPATFRFQPNPIPHRPLTPEQQIDYDSQVAVHDAPFDPATRVRFYRFFFLAPLYLVLPFFLPALKEARFVRVAAAIALFSLGDAFYPYFYPALHRRDRLSLRPRQRERTGTAEPLHKQAAKPSPSSWSCASPTSSTRHPPQPAPDPEGRIAIANQLANAPGKQLVFVRPGAHDWIHNAADIDAAPVVWALDLGPAEDAELRRYYPDRHAWLLEPGAPRPRLTEIR